MAVLSIDNLTFSYAKKRILDHFSLELPLNGLIALSGPSGCGKTTLLRIIANLERPASGSIMGLSPQHAVILFQEDRLLPWRTVREHILDVLPDSKKLSEAEVLRWLSFVELEKEQDAYPDSLSGGMARRLALARCCALGGEVLLLDEPFTGVDVMCRARLLERLKSLGIPMLLATHEQDVIEACQHVIYLQGPPLRCESFR